MLWKTILFGFLKGIVEVLADEYRLMAKRRAARRAPSKKEAPPEPTMEWGSPSPPPPIAAIRIETDEGSKVAAASFVGSEYFGQKRMEKERQPGESRRRRRKVQGEVAVAGVEAGPEAKSTSSAAEVTAETADASTTTPTSSPRSARPPRRPVLMLSTTTLATLARGAE